MSEYICIYNGLNLVEIELIKSKLSDASIPYILRNNDASGTLPHLKLDRGTEILIPKEKEEEAANCRNDLQN